MGPALPSLVLRTDQADVGLMDKGRGQRRGLRRRFEYGLNDGRAYVPRQVDPF